MNKELSKKAANFFKVIALSVTLNEYYSYLKDDLLKMEVEAYGLKIKDADRINKRKLERDFPKFIKQAEKNYNRLTKLLDELEAAFEKDYDKKTVQVFIDALHDKMNEIEVEVTK